MLPWAMVAPCPHLMPMAITAGHCDTELMPTSPWAGRVLAASEKLGGSAVRFAGRAGDANGAGNAQRHAGRQNYEKPVNSRKYLKAP
ncbi:hypothetical protein GCM10022402_02980 [Salinactinospora qingdaonensis]|uniref:Uncharacterized protein n=1 Tax=Salinactinospora qingdaonensis TaxID=702744 RepID=A0ABP7EYL4_9ACTN